MGTCAEHYPPPAEAAPKPSEITPECGNFSYDIGDRSVEINSLKRPVLDCHPLQFDERGLRAATERGKSLLLPRHLPLHHKNRSCMPWLWDSARSSYMG